MDFKHGLDFASYQDLAAGKIPDKDMYDVEGGLLVARDSVADLTLGLCGEIGRLSSDLLYGSGVTKEGLTAHLGATLWYVAAIATVFDIRLEDVASLLPDEHPPMSLEDPRTLVLEMASHAGILAHQLRAACFHRREFDFATITTEMSHILWRVDRLAPIFSVTLGEVARANVSLLHLSAPTSKQGDGHGQHE